jgi:hypothetical protein
LPRCQYYLLLLLLLLLVVAAAAAAPFPADSCWLPHASDLQPEQPAAPPCASASEFAYAAIVVSARASCGQLQLSLAAGGDGDGGGGMGRMPTHPVWSLSMGWLCVGGVGVRQVCPHYWEVEKPATTTVAMLSAVWRKEWHIAKAYECMRGSAWCVGWRG